MSDFPDPVPALKHQLAQALVERLDAGCQNNMARRLGIDQPRASNIQRGHLERFSLQQLIRFAARVDGVVNIDITWTSRRVWIFPRVRSSYSTTANVHAHRASLGRERGDQRDDEKSEPGAYE